MSGKMAWNLDVLDYFFRAGKVIGVKLTNMVLTTLRAILFKELIS